MTTRMWFLEVRADFVNKEKNDVGDQIMKNLGAEAHASFTLMTDGASVEVVVYSDDFMAGRRELEWLAARKEVKIQEDTAAVTEDETQTPVSDEMVEALEILRKRR
jgi:hypothetical protein